MTLIIPRSAGKMYLDKPTRARMKAQIDSEWAEEKRQIKIRSNSCPSCDGELIRGRRNKNNGYKREWACTSCFEIHTI